MFQKCVFQHYDENNFKQYGKAHCYWKGLILTHIWKFSWEGWNQTSSFPVTTLSRSYPTIIKYIVKFPLKILSSPRISEGVNNSVKWIPRLNHAESFCSLKQYGQMILRISSVLNICDLHSSKELYDAKIRYHGMQ